MVAGAGLRRIRRADVGLMVRVMVVHRDVRGAVHAGARASVLAGRIVSGRGPRAVCSACDNETKKPIRRQCERANRKGRYARAERVCFGSLYSLGVCVVRKMAPSRRRSLSHARSPPPSYRPRPLWGQYRTRESTMAAHVLYHARRVARANTCTTRSYRRVHFGDVAKRAFTRFMRCAQFVRAI